MLTPRVQANIMRRKRNGEKLGVSWALLLICGLIMTPVQAITMLNSQPVLWRGSKIPVISGYEKLNMRIELVSPCTLLTKEVVHGDLLDEARKLCDEIYNDYFIKEMEKMCPVNQLHVLSRTRRIVPIIAAAIGAVVVVGLAGLAWSGANSVRIGNLQETVDQQQYAIDYLNSQVNLTEIAYGKLRNDFNLIVAELKLRDEDFNELKNKGPGTQFAISCITTRLAVGKHIIQEATRAWADKLVLPGLLDYFNLTMPCGESCPLSLASARKCYFDHDKTNLYMQMDTPLVNQGMQLVEVDPFDIMLQTWNQTCRVTYKGPKNAILAKDNGCPVALNVRTENKYDLVLSPNRGCLQDMIFNGTNTHFGVHHCYPRGEHDAEEFVQVKPHHGLIHIYCAGSNITTDNHTQSCPNKVFILPLTAEFKINKQEFAGSIVNVVLQEQPDPLFTFRTNRYLQPRVDYKALMEDPMVNNHFEVRTGSHHYSWDSGSTWIHAGLIGMIIILVCILAKCYFDNKRIKVKVITKRRVKAQMQDEVSEGVLQPQD
jgi:hypothetical protein